MAVILTPILQLTVNPNLFITQSHADYIDPWVYTGYFLSFPRFIHEYAGTYYGTRLPWILPGYLLYSLFKPLTANYILHLSLDYALLGGLYLFVRHGAGRNLAMLVVLMTAWSPSILNAVSWDYVDGAGLVFIVWTFVCLERSIQSERSPLWLAGAGASAASAAASNLFLIALWPVFGLFYLVRQIRRTTFISTARDAAAAMAGAGATIVMYCAINRGFGGDWLFFAPSLRVSRDLLASTNQWATTGLLRFTVLYHLALPVAAVVGAGLACVDSFRHRAQPDSRFAIATQIALVAAFSIWTFFEFRGTPVLTQPYYAVYLVPLSVAALALQSKTVGLRLETSHALGILALTQILMLAVHWFILSDRLVMLFPEVHPDIARRYLEIDMVAALAPALGAVVALRRPTQPVMRWTMFVICMSIVYSLATARTFPWPSVSGTRIRFESIVGAHRFIDENAAGRELRFWYDASNGGLRRSIASTYLWGHRLLNEDWPALKSDEALTLGGKRLVLLLQQRSDLEQTIVTLNSYGLTTEHTVVGEIGSGDARLFVVLTDPVPEPSR